MKQLRNIIFWSHLVAGTMAGVIILIMSITGVLLTYQRQITTWADTRAYNVTPPAQEGSARLSVESLLLKVGESQPAAPTNIILRSDPTAPASVGFSGGRILFVNPYTGEVLGEGAQRVRAFFRTVTDWHRWLGAEGENRAAARAVTGACNLGFLFLVTSGFYLWWPRKWTGAFVRNVTWFRRGLPGKARDFNWHNVIGFWSVLPLFIIVLSGVVISYTWASNLVYKLAGETPPAPRASQGQPAGNSGQQNASGERRDLVVSLEGLDPLWSRAERQISEWKSISLQLPPSANAPLVFTIDQGDGGQPHKRAQLTLDRTNGEVIRWEPFSSYSTGRQLRSFLRFAHTGEVAGLIGQTIAGIASAGAVVLVWTGLALAWRRLRAWTARRRAISSSLKAATQ